MEVGATYWIPSYSVYAIYLGFHPASYSHLFLALGDFSRTISIPTIDIETNQVQIVSNHNHTETTRNLWK